MKPGKITELKNQLKQQGYSNQLQNGRIVIAISVTTGEKRARVDFYTDTSFGKAWRKVEQALRDVDAKAWVKVDLVINTQPKSKEVFQQELSEIERNNYWRKGISFDADFKTAFLENEINANAFFKPWDGHEIGRNGAKMSVDYELINRYFHIQHQHNAPFDFQQASPIWVFTTKSVFYDGENVMPLNSDGIDIGSRVHTELKTDLRKVIGWGQTFLKDQIQESGKFTYGYFPALQRVLTNYNTVRHFSSIYALLEASEFVDDSDVYPRIKRALDYGLKNLTLTQDGALFAVDHYKKKDDELKLGSQAMIILALCKYEEITGDKEYEPLMAQVLAALKYYRQKDHRYIHVLNRDLSVKEKFRIIYYDGEITFALARYYQLTHSEEAKTMLQESLDFMVKNNYGRFHDHWISYAVNEALIIFGNNTDYMKLGIHNSFTYLDFIEARDTAYPTLLELLDAANKMIDKVNASGNSELLAEFDVARMRQVQAFRAQHEMDTGTFLPEVAMYFFKPDKFVGGFFARHDNFRTRIDDCEHFLSGLVNYYNYVFK